MATVLPEVSSFGQLLGRNLGAGLGSGITSGLETRQKRKMIEQLLGQSQEQSGQLGQEGQELGIKDQSNRDPFARAKAAALSGEHDLSRILIEEGKFEREKAELPRTEYVKQEYKRLPKFLESVGETEDRLPTINTSVHMAEQAIEKADDLSGIKEFLADKTGFEGFRSAEGAELQSAIKQYFLGDLSSIKGGRPNQLIERQLLDAYPKIGRDQIANQKILAGLKMSQKLGQERVRVTRDLEEKFLSEKGFLPPGFESMVRKQLRPIADKLEKDTIKTLDSLTKFQNEYQKMASKNLQKGEILMLTPEGTYNAVPKEQYQEAKNAGYIKVS